jgi:3-hydroxyethyl bacteriochlorophyllide a dehydrogenase
MKTTAVVLEKPGKLALQALELMPAKADDVIVDIDYSGISTGTEKLLWTGQMPEFPGMGYPLVPGYESVGRVAAAGSATKLAAGQLVFVPGANCFGPVRGLFGGAASRVIVPEKRVTPIDAKLGKNAVLLALAATAYHAMARSGGRQPELIVGHGVLGRLLARLAVLAGGRPVVWESKPQRREGAVGYDVVAPEDDPRRDYQTVCDASGDAAMLERLIGRTGRGGEVVLAGFYREPLAFAFAPAFMREVRIRVAAEWQPPDLAAVKELATSGRLSLEGLVTHTQAAERAAGAYPVAFGDSDCLKMILDWSTCQCH